MWCNCDRCRRELMSIPRKGQTVVKIGNTGKAGKELLTKSLMLSRTDAVPENLRLRRRKMLQRWCKSDPVSDQCSRGLRRVRKEAVRTKSIQHRFEGFVLRNHIVRYNDRLFWITYSKNWPRIVKTIWRTSNRGRRGGLNTSRQARRFEDCNKGTIENREHCMRTPRKRQE